MIEPRPPIIGPGGALATGAPGPGHRHWAVGTFARQPAGADSPGAAGRCSVRGVYTVTPPGLRLPPQTLPVAKPMDACLPLGNLTQMGGCVNADEGG